MRYLAPATLAVRAGVEGVNLYVSPYWSAVDMADYFRNSWHVNLWPAAACSNGAHFATPHNDINGHPPSIIGS